MLHSMPEHLELSKSERAVRAHSSLEMIKNIIVPGIVIIILFFGFKTGFIKSLIDKAADVFPKEETEDNGTGLPEEKKEKQYVDEDGTVIENKKPTESYFKGIQIGE